MSKSSHAVKIQKGSTTYTCDLYTTTAEARGNLYPTYPLFRVTVGGTTLYAPFTPTLNSSTESTPFICPIFAGSGDNTNYCLAQHSFFSIGITTKSNETITVNAGGQSWTSGTKWFPYGTTWTASVSPSTGYNAGSISPASSGTLTNASVTVTAGNASLKTYTLTKSATNASTNQTLTVKYLPRNADGTYPSSWSTLSSGSVTLRHGSRWQATVSANTGYNAGTITNAGGTSSSMTGNVTVSVSAATAKNYTLKVKSTAVKVNGTARADNWSGSFAYNQQIKISNSSNCDYFVVRVWKNLDGSGTVWKESGKINSGGTYSFNMPASNVSVRITLYHEN